jgi:LacI family transcriptional regulator
LTQADGDPQTGKRAGPSPDGAPPPHVDRPRRPRAPGAGRPTLRDVARAADVHPSTVSRALDPRATYLVQDKTRARVRAIAADLGYRTDVVARSLRRRETTTVGVIVTDLGNPVFAPVLRGIARRLEASGFIALITETQDDRERLRVAVDKLRERRVDALIVGATRKGDAEILGSVVDDGIPVVLAVRSLIGSGISAVTADDFAGGEIAATYLAELGHVHVAEIAGPHEVRSFLDRSTGFRRAAEERGLSVVRLNAEPDDPSPDTGARLTEGILDRDDEPPTAIFAHNDSMAIGVLRALRGRGISCPGEISVLGYNDAPFSDSINPPLSTIGFPWDGIGVAAAEVALSLIEDPTKAVSSLTFPPTLMRRESTAGPRSRSLR